MESRSRALIVLVTAAAAGIIYLNDKAHAIATKITSSYQIAIADEKSAIWATLITDIITIAAALGALALPMSLNVIETTRNRYQSPSLLKLGTILTQTDPQSLNRHLFISLSGALVAKLTLSARLVEPVMLAPCLGVLALYFLWVIIKVYKHLKFTYVFMSNIESIHEKTISLIEHFSNLTFAGKLSKFKSLKKLQHRRAAKLPIQHIIPAFIELETYLICTSQKNNDINSRLQKASYTALRSLADSHATSFMHHVLDAFPPLLSRVEESREVDIYQAASSLYLYFIMMAIMANKEFVRHLPAIERIARFKEKNLPSYGRFCRNGRLFLDFTHQFETDTSPYPHLLSHFKTLIDCAVREQPENIPAILANISNIIQFKGNHQRGVWELPSEIPELWKYRALIELNNLVEGAYEGKTDLKKAKEIFETDHKQSMIHCIKGSVNDKDLAEKKVSAVDIEINKCWSGIALNRFATDIEVETLRMLALLLPTHPEIFINCRELRNPAGSRVINIGHSPVPSSIGGCVASFLDPRHFDERSLFRSDLQDYKIIDAIGALIVYELWSTYIIHAAGAKILPPMSCPPLPKLILRELKSGGERIQLLKDALMKALDNSKFAEKLRLLPEQIITLKKLALELHDQIGSAIDQQTAVLLTTQELNQPDLEKFTEKYKDELRECISEYPLFRNIKLASVEPFTFNINLPREAFLAGRDTHYVLDNYALTFTRDLNARLCSQILANNKNSYSASTTLPTQMAAWIICSHGALDDLKAQGFGVKSTYLTWPTGQHKVKFFTVHSDTNNFYAVQAGECLASSSYEINDSGLPIKISIEDNKENVTFIIQHFINT